MKTKCRECGKMFKFNGNAFGFCSKECEIKHYKECKTLTLFPNLTKELNKIAKEIEEE